jgi:hypothetical protein
MKKLILIAVVALAVFTAFAAAPTNAKALDGFSMAYNPCAGSPYPYEHVNVFGSAYCSMYP